MSTEIRGFINPGDDIEGMRFSVDIPKVKDDGTPSEEWHCVEYFETIEEAIQFAQDYFGADENGMVCLISSF